MSWLGLRHKGFEVLFPEEWNAVVDGLDILYAYWSGALQRKELLDLYSDIIPAIDDKFKLGDPNKAWAEIFGVYGYFRENLFVQGRRVLKDGDPITIAEISKAVEDSISEAINKSIVEQLYLETTKLVSVLSTPQQVLSGYSLGAGSSYDFVVSREEAFPAVVVAVRVAYSSSATAGVRVLWLYSPDGTNFDDEQDAIDQGNYEDIYLSPGSTVQRTILVPAIAPFTKIRIKNLDSSNAVALDVWVWRMR